MSDKLKSKIATAADSKEYFKELTELLRYNLLTALKERDDALRVVEAAREVRSMGHPEFNTDRVDSDDFGRMWDRIIDYDETVKK